MKLVFEEPESGALADWLSARPDLPKLTSQLSVVEVVRIACRLGALLEPAARRLLAGLDLIPISAEVMELATHVGPASLPSLDAIQLASAITVRDGLTAVVAYDQRLREAAESERLPVTAPA